MFNFLRGLLAGNPSVAPTTQARTSAHSDVDYMEVLLLGEFDKPRRVRSVAYGWNDQTKTALIRKLLDKGHLVVGSPAERIGKAWTVEQLRAWLTERGHSAAGKKPDLVARLLSCDPHAADRVATDVLRYSPAGKARYEEWRRPIEKEGIAAATTALAALARGEVIAAQDVIAGYWARFPPVRHFAEEGSVAVIHAYDHINAPRIEAILRATPSILRELSPHDMQRARLAAAIWNAGLPNPGATLAMRGYKGRFALDSLLLIFRESAHFSLEVSRLRKRAASATVHFFDPCLECAKLDGKTFPLSDFPEIPNPGCMDDGACRVDIEESPPMRQ